ncbi:hypothetical protein CPB83DRAFT_879079 [Crepidotus variabilis]|uniref:Lysine-specific metallo-endopeptidase domain-containing protein n=1 Tax=Crepidotus variabilis TaxID=179855 RepID=A0A9P6EU71_9AGAR|nr:hypothetical protein CPB83DRAFT_879079 [Crepidotus variabilis]
MKLFVALVFCFLALFGVAALPLPAKSSDHVEIRHEKAQTIMHGKEQLKNIKNAAADSHFLNEQSVRVANFPENPENHAILVEVFKNNFMPLIENIRQNLVAIRDGKLLVEKVNAGADCMGKASASVDPSTKLASFGPKFHSKTKTKEERAGIFIHEKSHAFANTKDYFAKSDGRPLGASERKHVANICGYADKDIALLSSYSSVWNADSYKKLAELAVRQYKANHGHPPAKK